ncbi:MAG: 3-dehydroquinate synthase [Erysipelotrichia bacterium]|nr:3-dehydroquinate synthase [Erysipelotrichia bacterium]
MNDLDKFRTEINEIDKQMTDLFERRMKCVREIAKYKKENNLPIYDENREKEVIEKNCELLKDKKLTEYYQKYLIQFMNISKEYQQQLNEKDDIISVNSSEGKYEVVVKRGCLEKIDQYFSLNRKVLIIMDKNVPELYRKLIVSKCLKPVVAYIQAQEKNKNLIECAKLWDMMLQNNFNRHDCVIAFGGGIIGDLGGFVASTYMRGIDFYNVPTTLLADVDASIGGKTAVNYSGYKNIIGCFYPPKKVLIDINMLNSLPERQIRNGLAEAIKMAVLRDKELFSIFENDLWKDNINSVIYRCLQIKKDIVQQDEREGNIRKILNFGHTVGHGLEMLENDLYHGEGVALGMLTLCSNKLYKRLTALYKKIGFPIKISIDENKLIEIISHDKKSLENGIDIIYAEDVEEIYIRKVSLDYLRARINMIKKGTDNEKQLW